MRTIAPALLLASIFLRATAPLCAQGVEVQLETLTGQNLRGQLATIGPDGALQGTGWAGDLNLSFISLIDFGRPVRPAAEGSLALKLVGGGQFWIRNPRTADEQLKFESDAVSDGIPLDAVAAIVWRDNERVAAAIAAPLPDSDQIVVETPDGTAVVAGLLESLTIEKVQVSYQDKSRTIGLEKVSAIVPANVGAGSIASSGNEVRLFLTDGSILNGQIQSLSRTDWSLQLANGSFLKGPGVAISRIEVASQRQAQLSDLTPLESEQQVLFGQPREWTRDQSLGRGALQLQTRPGGPVVKFRKGLGMRATTRVVFANDRGFTKLIADVGLDPELGQQGDCEVAIRGDGIELWKRRLQASQPAERVDLEIAGYRRIELSVLSGEQFDLGDFVNWCNPRLLKLDR